MIKLLISRRSAYLGTTSRNIMRAAGSASAASNRRMAQDAVQRARSALAKRAGLKEELIVGASV